MLMCVFVNARGARVYTRCGHVKFLRQFSVDVVAEVVGAIAGFMLRVHKS